LRISKVHFHFFIKKGYQAWASYPFFYWCRGTESNCRHGDFQTKFLKIQKSRNYKQLILFQFFIVFLVSFGTVWKYLTMTGTIWAQSYSIRSFQKNDFSSLSSRFYVLITFCTNVFIVIASMFALRDISPRYHRGLNLKVIILWASPNISIGPPVWKN
jgi:hypothetical protein